jgi:hypothetical protein
MSPCKLKLLTEDQVAELWTLFGPPPVLSTENQQAYDKLCAEYAVAYRPRSALHVRLIREVVDTEWEICRLIRHNTVAIERYFRKKLDNKVLRHRYDNQKDQQRAKALAASNPKDVAELAVLEARVDKTRSDIEKIFSQQATEIDHNFAIEHGAEFLDALDKWLNTATVRRNNALKLLEYYCGKPPDDSEAIETEFLEIEPKKLAQTASPSITPKSGSQP